MKETEQGQGSVQVLPLVVVGCGDPGGGGLVAGPCMVKQSRYPCSFLNSYSKIF